MAVYYHKKPIVRDGLVFQVDANNNLSYVSGDTTTTDTINQVTGTLTNGVGYTDNAWDFDGVNDYIDFGNIVLPDDEITVEIWANWTTIPTDTSGHILVSYATNALNGWSLYGPTGPIGGLYDYWSVYVQTTTGQKFIQPSTNRTLEASKWFNLIVTFNATTLKLYVNGVLSDSKVSTGTIVYNGSAKLHIGKWTNGSSYFHGLASTLKIYNRALTPDEIKQNYESQKYRYI